MTAVKALVLAAYRDDVTVTHDEIGEGEVMFTVTHQGNNTEKDLNAEVTVTFTDARTESRITLKGDKTAFDVMQNGFTKVYAEGTTLEDAIWATTVDAEKTTVAKDCMTVNESSKIVTIEFTGDAGKKPAKAEFTYTVVDSRQVVVAQEGVTVPLGFDGNNSIDYDETARNISAAVFGDRSELGYGDMTFESSVEVINKTYTKFVKLKGENVNIPVVGTIGYPAISEGPQKLRFTFGGNAEYQGFTDKEVTVTIKARDPSEILLDEDVYVVGVGKDANAETIRQAILDQVVTSVTPEEAKVALTVKYNANSYVAGDKIQIWKNLDAIPMQKEVEIQISRSGNRAYKGTSVTKSVFLDNRHPTKIVLNEGQSVVYEYYEDEYAALEQSVLNAVLNQADSELPEGAKLDLAYKAQVELNLDGTTVGAEGLKESLLKIPGIKYIPGLEEKIEKLDLSKVDLGDVAVYPPITAGEQEIRVSFAGNEEYSSSSASVKVTIEKAPVSVTANSKTIYADDSLTGMYTATRTDNGRDVTADAYVVYAGISANATVDLYLTIPANARSSMEYRAAYEALKVAGLDLDQETITLSDLFGKLGSAEKVAEILKLIFGQNDPNGILGKIGDALEQANGGALGDVAASLKKGLVSAIQTAGPSIRFHINQTPEHKAGAYGVVVFLDDVNYKAASNGDRVKAGYLIIMLRKLDVKVNSTTITAGEQIPDNFIVAPPDAKVYAIYSGVTAGVTTGLWIDLPEGAAKPQASTVGELWQWLKEHPADALAAVNITDSTAFNYLFKLLAGAPDILDGKLSPELTELSQKLKSLADDTPVNFGQPSQAGVYTVAAIAAQKTEGGDAWAWGWAAWSSNSKRYTWR